MRGYGRYRDSCPKFIAVAIIIAGLIILLSSIPCWMWLSMVGLAMVVIGFLLLLK